MSGYTQRQIQLAKWNNRMNQFRQSQTTLKKLNLKGKQGNLMADNVGDVMTGEDVVVGNKYIGRIYLDDDYSYWTDRNEREQFPPEDWVIDFETGDQGLLQDNHLFVVPSVIDGKDVSNSDIYLRVDLRMAISYMTDDYYYFDEGGAFGIELVKNNTESIYINSEGATSIYGHYYLFIVKSLFTSDIIKCKPGDTIDLYLVTNTNVKLEIAEGRNRTNLTFSVIRID